MADSLGRKRVFLAAAVLFTSSSLLCGLAANIGMLIGLRFLQAAGGAAFMPSASGIVMDAFGSNRNRALGMFSSIFPLGALVGPIVGGIIITTWSWRGVFLVNVPIGMTFTLLAWRFLPSSPGQGGRPDLVGALLLGGGVVGLMLAITDVGSRTVDVTSPACAFPPGLVASSAAGPSCAAAPGWRTPDPGTPAQRPGVPGHQRHQRGLGGVRHRVRVAGAAVRRGPLRPHSSGLGHAPHGQSHRRDRAGHLASVLIHRTGYRVPIIVGIGLIAGGLAMIATRARAALALCLAGGRGRLYGLGTGMSAPAANNASIELAPDDVGAITGLRGAARQGGAIVGIALATSVAAHTGHEVQSLTQAFFVLAASARLHGASGVPDPRRKADFQ